MPSFHLFFHFSEFVSLPKFEAFLTKLTLFYRLKCPILIEGPMGCGKSSLIEEFHRRSSQAEASTPVILNMGEQSDAKTLFGAFVTNPARPGEFCWKAGVILEALSSGRWLVIEDVDLASPEMIATVKGLLESKLDYFVAAMGRSFPIHENFRLIATRRSDSFSASAASTAFDRLGRDLWQSLCVPSLTAEELAVLLAGRFPKLTSILVSVILRLFAILESEISSNSLFKFCSRIVLLVNLSSGDEFLTEELRRALLYEAVDCFASSWNCRDQRKELAKRMSLILSLPENEVDELYEGKPLITLNYDRSHLSIGRVDFAAESQGMSRFRSTSEIASSMAPTTLSCQTLEKLAVAVRMNEPVLLVGETGTGKTTTVQHLAQMLQFQPNLRVLNMSQQSEASDLLGGFKPFSAQSLARPLLEEFLAIFGKAFSKSKNTEYLVAIQEAFTKQSWKRFVKLIKQAVELIASKQAAVESVSSKHVVESISSKQAVGSLSPVLLERLRASLDRFEGQVAYAANNLLFSFVEGSLVEALTEGHWLLLDEINLASPETLNILAGLLRDPSSSVTLTERGDSSPILRHPNFRLFACMNPATDVSKRDLPPAIRSRFTTIFVDETDVRRDDLRQVIDHLIGPGRDGTLKERLTALYYRLKDLVQSFELVDGNGRKPLLNLRTLTRPIKFARSCESIYGLERALYEGWCLSFTTMLDESSAKATREILREFLMPTSSTLAPLRPFTSAIPSFTSGKQHILVEGHVLLTGPLYDACGDSSNYSFVLTPSVLGNVAMLSRAVMARNYPILLEGPTSAGKTSVIEYLAKRTGHHFVRINNHEHTDIQEYLGTYVSDPDTGRLVFKEGILVQALRKGHWLVLDELNLAPSDILEALNRLLDDNRELFLPETGETVRPHPDFHLFATQNPAGAVYGGRKALSRAFRSRFLELQFNDLPLEEVEQILSSRCQIAPSFARRIAQVYRVLQERRSTAGTNIFAGKHALITLRDCFRWADRHSHSAIGSTKELAQDGYFVLAERCRHPEEAQFIRSTLEKVCKTQLDSDYEMYNLSNICQQRGWTEDLIRLDTVESLARDLEITWTKPIRRLFALVYLCIRFREPVILVGETGCGKTTVCQLVAQILQRALKIVNCHANSESGDFLGSFRPVRTEEMMENENTTGNNSSGKLFQWTDGPLVESMKQGHLFLMDEISLADDSVLERLNSVLEPSRYLLLAECTENDEVRVISASENFAILATMNPGGDFGKKELSPALRNRFTEIWVPTIGDRQDLELIVSSHLNSNSNVDVSVIDSITDFWYWWQESILNAGAGASILSASKRTASSLRDLLGWLQFVNSPEVIQNISKIEVRLLHGAAMMFTDRLGSENVVFRLKTLNHLADTLSISQEDRLQVIEAENSSKIQLNSNSLSIGPFELKSSQNQNIPISLEPFAFEAPTTRVSALRVLRALQLGKAVLLEGSPGVGKTTLIGALASSTGHRLTRINLSEQTDLVDLFGSDLPVDGGVAGRFRWADGPFLQALKRGDWILLDELNLASQSVLEGLNACLDHRGSVFIPELGREFECSPGTRIFAAQNPAGQGGGRKGLPKSFLNRFTIVWFDSLCSTDYHIILASNVRPQDPLNVVDISKMIQFNEALNENVSSFSSNGRPWEFNLRDLTRWIRLIQNNNENSGSSEVSPVQFIRALYASRFRCEEDHQVVGRIVESIYGPEDTKAYFHQMPSYDFDDSGCFKFQGRSFPCSSSDSLLFLRDQLVPLEAAFMALQMGWLCILTGSGASGKSALIDSLALLHKSELRRFFVSPDTDTLELLGSFEQVDYQRRWNMILEEVSLYTQMGSFEYLSDYTNISNEQFSNSLLGSSCPESLKQSALKFLQTVKNQSSEGRFEWVDGPLVRAMTLGQWLVLENVNLASSAVLDRLNSLFEPNGFLVLSEQGCASSEGVRVIRPSPGFRLFMTVDPKFGEISRAMRNRGIEISCFPRAQTRVLDDLQILRQSCHDDPRMVQVLHKLLPLKPSRRLLHRISQAASLITSASVDELLNLLMISPCEDNEEISLEDSYWLQSSSQLPFIISASTKNIPWTLQNAMIQASIRPEEVLSIDKLALINLFLLKWSDSESDQKRFEHVSHLIQLQHPVQSQICLLIEFVKNYFNLSPNDLELLQLIVSSGSDNNLLFGYLLWVLTSDQNRSLQSHDLIIRRLAFGSTNHIINSTSSLDDWINKWRHYGFKEELCAQIYLSLRSFSCSEAVLESSEALQIELLEGIETVLSGSNGRIDPELLIQLERFTQILSEKQDQLSNPISSSLSKQFLTEPLILIFLNRIESIIHRRIPLKRASLTQEWLSQVWSLCQDPLNFFSGFDGLGGLLETANRTWNKRTVREESDLMAVYDDVLKFVVKHGGKDKRMERLHLLKGLFTVTTSESVDDFATNLINSSLTILRESLIDFDPVTGHFLVNQRSLSSVIEFYASEDRWNRIYKAAYVGSTFLISDHFDEIKKVETEIKEIDEFILIRPVVDQEILTDLQQICTSRLRPLLLQITNESVMDLNRIQSETLQNSLLRVRMELISPRFVLYRDLTAVFVDAIDRLKVGLYLKQIEKVQETSSSGNILPFDFVSKENNWTFSSSTCGFLVADTISLNLARYIPTVEASELVLPVLSRTLEIVHEAIKVEAARNVKDDGLFVFKGSNNDDDAMDTELASELFGDFEKRSKPDHNLANDEEDEQEDVFMETEINSVFNLHMVKRINYQELSLDLLHICEGIASDSTNLSQITDILSRSFDFLSKSVNLNEFSDQQVYRMLIWTLSEKLAKRRSIITKSSRAKFNSKASGHYDFYRDPCPEGRLQDALKVLEPFNVRLYSLLEEWPEHDVLQALQKQIERFLVLPVQSTSMIEALLSLEKLYLRSQDWEKYAASSQTSLGQPISDLLLLIVDWRRAEVENWKGLIDAVVIKMENDAIIKNGEWLSIARVALAQVEDSGKESSIKIIIELIDAFMISAPVGQFSKRLEILEFCTQLALKTCRLGVTANAFNAALLYYQNTLSHRIKEYVRMCREPVERDLSAFLMTLYWKDINYWSVRQTAEKSHRHLARMIRKWKESMQMPLSSLLNKLTIKAQLQAISMEPVEAKKYSKSKSVISSTPTRPLTSLGIKVKDRLDALDFSVLEASVIDTFGGSILDTLKELKESTEASIQSKQKAFVDLIRELKVLGIRINRNPSDELLAAKSIICSYAQASNLDMPRDLKAEYYLIRTLEKWQKLSASVAHDDITFRQAEIIKNSMAYLIESLVCGKPREVRDIIAKESSHIRSLIDSINYRLTLKEPRNIYAEAYAHFSSTLWKAQVQLNQLIVMFESHKAIQNSKLSPNWNILTEIFSLTKSSVTEISNILQGVKNINNFEVSVPLNLIERISALLKSLKESYAAIPAFVANEEDAASLQISDLIFSLNFTIDNVFNSWNLGCCKEFPISPEISSIESDGILRKILLSVQFCETETPHETLDEFAFYPNYLWKQSESSLKIIKNLSSSVLPALETILSKFSSCPLELIEISLLIGGKLLSLVDSLVVEHYRSQSRLTLILSNVFLHLFQEGFCRPPPPNEDEKQQDDENSKDGKLTEGTGIGEGEGEKNVSKEIEFEEQVTGTLDEKEEKQKDEKKEEEKGDEEDKLDMSQDFDGALEDLMNEEEKNEDDDQEKKEGEESSEEPIQDQLNDEKDEEKEKKPDPNEQVQDLDPSWWNSENEDDDVDAPENAENQQIPDKDNQENAKSSDDKKEPPKKKREEQAMTASTKQDEGEASDDLDAAEFEEEKNDNLDVDADVDMEDGEIVDESEQEPDPAESTEDSKDVDNVNMEDVEPEDFNPEDESSLEKDQKEDAETVDEDMENSVEEPSTEPSYAPSDDDESESVDKDEEKEKDDNSNSNDSKNNENENVGNDELQQEHQQEAHDIDNKQGDTMMQTENDQKDQQKTGSEQQIKTFDTQGRSSNSQNDQSESSSMPQPIQEQVEKWKRTINRILKNETKIEQESFDQSQLDKLTKEQQYEQAADSEDKKSMIVKAEAEEAVQINGEDSTSQEKASLNAAEPGIESGTDGDEAEKEAKKDESTGQEADLKLVPHLSKSKQEEAQNMTNPMDKELEEHLKQLSLLPSWPEFEQNTTDLAFDLCEQLRLVLAPTQATKLKGDYRTGKRLNLRKILPYIASQYRRDKIWLRRTKPSQRNYRVCLSIDNSKSMMETGSVGLAFEAIATISQALERLEVGELALIGFGEHSRVLQPFASGVAKVSVGEQLRSDLLCFDESSTDMPELLQTVLDTFESAQHNTNGPIWQLNVILSDGICHQHDKIKPLLARCHSARILNIFVLLDNRPAESSIFELSHVEYVEQGVDPLTGQVKTGIKMTKYLETFPFEFYVVLRNVKMLPSVLAESLKQWFELISLQEGEH